MLYKKGHWFEAKALEALPILVRQAVIGKPITYTNLCHEIDARNTQKVAKILYNVGVLLQKLEKKWGEEIPPLQALTVSKTTGLPGHNVAQFLRDVKYDKMNRSEKKKYFQVLLARISSYRFWDTVLDELGLKPPSIKNIRQLNKAAAQYGRGGEGPAHKALKKYVEENSEILKEGIFDSIQFDPEKRLSSGDPIDVSLKNKTKWLAVEVKPIHSPESDILRGIYQCIKYAAVMEAMNNVERRYKEIKAILVLEGNLTGELVRVKNSLGVTVIENLNP